jgi:transcriptional regulator with XRE-family HTH domain
MATYVLRGWIAGDGYSRCKRYKNGVLREIGISCKKLKREPVVQLFSILNVSFREDKNNIYFYDPSNLMICYENNLLALNPYKQINLLRALDSYQLFPSLKIKRKFETYKIKIKNEISQIETKLQQRKTLFTKLSKQELPNKNSKFQPSSWDDFIKGLMITFNTTPFNFAKMIGSGKGSLEKWLNKKVNPSTKYQNKIISLSKGFDLRRIENLGRITKNIKWKYLLNGIMIKNRFTRKDLAQSLSVSKATVESIINRRDPSFTTINKIFKQVKYEEVEKLINLAKIIEKTNWKKLVTEILNKNNLTQQQLAEKFKCSRSLVREWKAGNSKPTTICQMELLKLASVFY